MPEQIIVIEDGKERKLINMANVISAKWTDDAIKLFTTGSNGGGVEILKGRQVQAFESWLSQNATHLVVME